MTIEGWAFCAVISPDGEHFRVSVGYDENSTRPLIDTWDCSHEDASRVCEGICTKKPCKVLVELEPTLILGEYVPTGFRFADEFRPSERRFVESEGR